MLTLARLTELLDYNPETGIFRWRVRRGWVKSGSIAGTLHKTGYIQILIEGRKYSAHRLAWFFVHGEWPTSRLDHEDRDTEHNAIENLRPATASLNGANSGRYRTNTSGFKGVSWIKSKGRFTAAIGVNNRTIRLGYFDCPKAAHAAYCVAAKKHFGEFARTE